MLRRGPTLVMIGLLAFGVPHAVAQGTTQADLVVDDDAGDVRVAGTDTEGDGFEHADILRIWVSSETADTFAVSVQLAAWETPAGEPHYRSREITIGFDALGHAFLLATPETCDGGFAFVDPPTGGLASKCFETSVDASQATVTVTVDKDEMVALAGLPFSQGAVLDGFRAEVHDNSSAYPFLSTGSGPHVVDRAPDSGGAGTFDFRFGLAAQGDIELFADAPRRWSNGGAMTLVFPVEVRNRGAEDATILLTSRGEPEQWTLRVPEVVPTPAASTTTVPVVVTMPGAHSHGRLETFSVLAEASTGTAAVELAVEFPEIPSPAGHHDTLYFHREAAEDSPISVRLPWMNTVEDDPNPGTSRDPFGTYGMEVNDTNGRSRFSWLAKTNPQMRLGLDFDLTREAGFVTAIESDAPIQDAVGWLVLDYRYTTDMGASRQNLAHVGPVELGDLGGGQTSIEWSFPIPSHADFIPYRDRAYLDLELIIEGHGVTQRDLTRWDLARTSLTLPLFDYHDPVDTVLAGDGLSMQAVEASSAVAAPGSILVFPFLVNASSPDEAVRLDVAGRASSWAHWQEGDSFAPGGSQAHLVVEIPEDTPPQTTSVFAIAETDGTYSSAAHRIDLRVTHEAEVVDQREAQQSDASTPWPACLAMMALLWGACRRWGA